MGPVAVQVTLHWMAGHGHDALFMVFCLGTMHYLWCSIWLLLALWAPGEADRGRYVLVRTLGCMAAIQNISHAGIF